jgi:nitrogen regulatory protein PII
MKMFFVIYSRVVDEEIIATFKRSGMRGYTKMKEVCGEGQETEPKLGTHIWPGMNNALFVVVEDGEVKKGLDLIRQLKKAHPREGLKAFVLPLEECI